MIETTSLIAALGSSVIKTRRDAAARLGRSGRPGAVMPLVEALCDTHPVVRRETALALGRLDDDRAAGPYHGADRLGSRGQGRGDRSAWAIPGPPGGHSSHGVPE